MSSVEALMYSAHENQHLLRMENMMRSALVIALAISTSAATTAWAQNAQATARLQRPQRRQSKHSAWHASSRSTPPADPV